MELLSKEELTTREIHDKTGYDMDLIWQYVNQFKSEEKIKKIGNKGRFSIYTAIKQDFHENDNKTQVDKKILDDLKFLNDFFKNNIDYLLKSQKIDKFIEENESKFNEIEKVIENA